jgi:8'-apo-carotenoid 13,14-cleaving dioxygenase
MATAEVAIRAGIAKGFGLIARFNRRWVLPHNDSHPFLTGAHKPMSEEKTLVDLQVTGRIPAELDGRYLRIGPNPVKPDSAGYHWFSGDGMVHGVALQGGRALWYRNRWIRSKTVSTELGEAPAPGPRHGLSDAVNTNVVAIGGRTFALVEAGGYPVELSQTLEGQTHNPFDGTLGGSFTAHPHRDPLTGEYHAIAYEATVPDSVRALVLSPDGKVISEKSIPVKSGPSIHDSAITARYTVILDLPVTFSMKAMLGGHLFPYAWNRKHQARVGLLPRAGSAADIIWCDVSPCYVFHFANAFDRDDGCVVMDVVAYDTMFAASRKGPDTTGRFERWIVDPVARSVVRRVVDASAQEFPRPDERRFGLPYRYAYAIAIQDGTTAFGTGTCLYKHDLEAGTRESHQFGAGRHPGEFVFVPRAQDSAEDEGWLVGLVINLESETTDLVIIDARDFEGEPVASVRIPHRVPPGFHGNWLAS